MQHHLYHSKLIYVTVCCDQWCQTLSINQGIYVYLELLTDQVPEQFYLFFLKWLVL